MGFKTPSKRGRSSWTKTQQSTPRKKGLFEDGQWLCMFHRLKLFICFLHESPLTNTLLATTGDCRKPALFLLVKKEGPNKGKHFYTCDTKKCSFFLWEHDAQAREREALITHNCRSENGIVGRIQAKGEPPATPVFARSTKPMPPTSAPPPQQKNIFTGMPPAETRAAARGSSGSSVSQDSDFLDYSADEDESQQAQVGSGTSSATIRNNNSVAKAPTSAHDRMPGFAIQHPPTTPSAKRKRGGFLEDSDEEFGGDDLDGLDMERELAAAADESVRKVLFKTPAVERTVDHNGLPTPSTRTNRDSLLAATKDRETSNKRLRFAEPEPNPEEDETQSQSQSQSLPAGQGHALYFGDIGTPTPYRKTDAFAPSFEPATPTTARLLLDHTLTVPSPSDYPRITDEVMTLLSGHPEATRRDIRLALERHELCVKGVAKGRDVARAALQARDRRIAELQARVVALENARRMDRGRLKELSEGLMSLTKEDGE